MAYSSASYLFRRKYKRCRENNRAQLNLLTFFTSKNNFWDTFIAYYQISFKLISSFFFSLSYFFSFSLGPFFFEQNPYCNGWLLDDALIAIILEWWMSVLENRIIIYKIKYVKIIRAYMFDRKILFFCSSFHCLALIFKKSDLGILL